MNKKQFLLVYLLMGISMIRPSDSSLTFGDHCSINGINKTHFPAIVAISTMIGFLGGFLGTNNNYSGDQIVRGSLIRKKLYELCDAQNHPDRAQAINKFIDACKISGLTLVGSTVLGFLCLPLAPLQKVIALTSGIIGSQLLTSKLGTVKEIKDFFVKRSVNYPYVQAEEVISKKLDDLNRAKELLPHATFSHKDHLSTKKDINDSILKLNSARDVILNSKEYKKDRKRYYEDKRLEIKHAKALAKARAAQKKEDKIIIIENRSDNYPHTHYHPTTNYNHRTAVPTPPQSDISSRANGYDQAPPGQGVGHNYNYDDNPYNPNNYGTPPPK